MSRKIAILICKEFCFDRYGDGGDSYQKVVDSISDWQEVTDTEFKTLQNGQAWFNYMIVEQPVESRQFVDNTIKAWKKKVAEEEDRRERERKEREEKALVRKHKKDLKDKESKKKLLARLKAELGE